MILDVKVEVLVSVWLWMNGDQTLVEYFCPEAKKEEKKAALNKYDVGSQKIKERI